MGKSIDELNDMMRKLESSAFDLQLVMGDIIVQLLQEPLEFPFPVEIPVKVDDKGELFSCLSIAYDQESDMVVCIGSEKVTVPWGDLSMDAQLEMIRSSVDVLVARELYNPTNRPGGTH